MITKKIDLTANRIRWSLLTEDQMRQVFVEALMHGDRILTRRVERALDRRAVQECKRRAAAV